ncbi:hypothetical protein [Nocardia sp. CA-120079]|uniref:hypothetical protein n=1 Tax=Nocardia sp. CA-120079 TaxID=3239974 RepID=UPI003D95EE20
MSSRNRKRGKRTCMDSAAVARVTTTARTRPDSPTARSGFAARAVAAQPTVPAWIAWLLQNAGEDTARFIYQLHYPLDYGLSTDQIAHSGWGAPAAESLIRNRAYKAESAARGAFRACLRRERGIISAQTPELPDDDAFYACGDSREWTGHWYSRDPVDAPEWQPQ